MRDSDHNTTPLTWLRNLDKKAGEVSFAVLLSVEQLSLLKEVRVSLLISTSVVDQYRRLSFHLTTIMC